MSKIRPVGVGRPGRPVVAIGGPLPVLVMGPCVIESERHARKMAKALAQAAATAALPVVFKASFDKANRTSHRSYRGPGLEAGLAILAGVGDEFGLPVTTDVHEPGQVEAAATAVDLLQVPAFLCRQTDLVVACARSGVATSIKKGQFLAPWDCRPLVDKFHDAGGRNLVLIERGTTFGYNNLVSDLRSLPLLRDLGVPVIYDGTHSVQMPGGAGTTSGGAGHLAPALMRAALAVGVEGLFLEVHENPAKALSDGPNVVPLRLLPAFLEQVVALHAAIGRPPPPRPRPASTGRRP